MDERTVFQPRGGGVGPGVRLNGVYEIESLIAQGGMGEVFKGFNIQTGDPVAIKMIRGELSQNPDALALFRREASILHNVVHEAIVRYFVFSVDPDLQRAYLAMEYVDGPSLSKRLAAGPMPLAEVKILQSRIAGALDAAHRLGVVHRDLSSDNIILQGGDVRRAKVIDFGIARSHRPGEATIIGGGFAGKYNYVSPEQLGLAGGDVTFKSDIYSFGLVLAEALRGRPLDMSGSQVEIIEKRRRVPDLGDIDPAMRPLIAAMLQPAPADRPASMAAVAAWSAQAPSPGGGKSAAAPRGAPQPPQKAKGGGYWLVVVAALIALAAIGLTAYAFREDVAQRYATWFASPPPPAQPVKPPAFPAKIPTAPEPAKPQPPASEPAPPTPPPQPPATEPSQPPTPEPAKPQPGVPSADQLVDMLPPHAPQAALTLPPATVGSPYHVEAPAFADPGGKGLRLSVEGGLPEGLTFKDLGGGRAVIDGSPLRAGASNLAIVATNHNGAQARMSASVTVIGKSNAEPPAAPKPPPSSPPAKPPSPGLARVALEGAKVGQDYRVALPPFSAGSSGREIALHAEPNPPEGLSLVDLGSGFSELSGRPARAGEYAFDVVGLDKSGQSGRMQVRIAVAPVPKPLAPEPAKPQPAEPEPVKPAQPEAPQSAVQEPAKPAPEPVKPTVVEPAPPAPGPAKPSLEPATPEPAAPAPESPTQRAPAEVAAAYVGSFAGGACFFVRPTPGAADFSALQAVGADRAVFQRFDEGYTQAVGAEAKLSARLIAPAACPAIALMKLGANNPAPPPRLELASYDVGRGKPLAGKISNLAGRKATLLVVDNDGVAHKLDAKPAPDGETASFSVPMTPDASSIGPLQIVIVVASTKPIASLESLRSAPAADLAPRLANEIAAAGGAVETEFFRLAK